MVREIPEPGGEAVPPVLALTGPASTGPASAHARARTNRLPITAADQEVLRRCAPQVLAALMRKYRDFEAAEDALQEALLAASVQWPAEGMPASPLGWLITVASRRLTDEIRRQTGRRRREVADAELTLPEPVQGSDDTLTVLYLCCHPSLTPASQIALTLRAVGGLTTAEIARAFLVPETTMAQRVSRAKQRIKASGAQFRMPPPAERAERMRALLHVLYLIFNEGYTSTSGTQLQRTELAAEAILLTRAVRRLLPENGEVAGLLALMLLIDGRHRARTRPDGALVPLSVQDRDLWDRESINEGIALITDALAHTPLGPYQVQAAIAAVHSEAVRAEDTDWPQILVLYELLEQLGPGPMVTLSRAVALAMVQGPQAGLAVVASLEEDERMTAHHRLHAVTAHLLELAGDDRAARDAYLTAARLTTSLPEQRYLKDRAARLTRGDGWPRPNHHATS